MEITVDDVDEGEIDKVAKALSQHVVQVSTCQKLQCSVMFISTRFIVDKVAAQHSLIT